MLRFHSGSRVRGVFLTILLFAAVAGPCGKAQDIPTDSSVAQLSSQIEATWTNSWWPRILPPGVGNQRIDLGVVAFTSSFDTNFIASLVGVTNAGVCQYPLTATETNAPSQHLRIWWNAAGAAVQSNNITYNKDAWIATNYGAMPSYIAAVSSNAAQWTADRAPERLSTVVYLMPTSSLPTYLASLTNSAGSGLDASNNLVSLLSLWSNDIAVVGTAGGSPVSMYLHAPATVTNMGIFGSTNLLLPSWRQITTLPRASDPILWAYGGGEEMNIFALGDMKDSDGDGLSDAQEMLLYGTDPLRADSDGDGIADGLEIRMYGTNPLNTDSDGDGLSDADEIAAGTSPNNTDTDGDGLSDYDEENIYFTDPLDADTDGDGLSDYDEVITYGTYPGYNDSDFDGLHDGKEVTLATNPRSADTDSDGIDDNYEADTNSVRRWDALDPSTASQDDDNDGISNLTAYQWAVNPEDGTGISDHQNLITRGPGSNAIRRVAAANFQLAVGDWGQYSSVVRVRPYRINPTNLLSQLLFHSTTTGFYINGTAASAVANPIQIAGQSNEVEFKVTCDKTALGTNITFSLTNNNNAAGTDCLATFSAPKVTKVQFDGPQMYTNVNYGTTGTLYVGMTPDTNACRLYMKPYQSPTSGNGIPNLYWTDWLLVKVTGDGADPTNSTLNELDYHAAYGTHTFRETKGIKLTRPGAYFVEVGFDMNGDGQLAADEVQESCNVYVVKIDINGDYNRDGSPADNTNEALNVLFEGPKGFVIQANNNDDDGNGEPDSKQDSKINTNDLNDIVIFQVAKFGIPSAAISTNMSMTISVLSTDGAYSVRDAYIYPKRAVDTSGGTTLSFAPSALTTNYADSGLVDLGIEGRTNGAQVLVRLTVKANGIVLGTDEIRVLITPWLALSNDRQVSGIYAGFGDYAAFTYDMNALFGSGNITWKDGSVWRQDEGEFGYSRSAIGQTTYSSRSDILDMSASPDYKALISPTKAWEDDVRDLFNHAGGGIEVSMPDAGHPYGRLILSADYSNTTGCAFFERQKLQWPAIFLPVSWLWVGHVDEVMSVVPVGASSVICVGDLTSAITILNDYATYPTNEVEESFYLSRTNLTAYYNDPSNAAAISAIQGYLDQSASVLGSQLGVSIIRIPVAYTLEYEGSGNCKTALPNSVNAAVANVGGTVKYGVPDPRFFPFRDVIANRLGFLGSNAHWINCAAPHSMGGEAHCASNTDKVPP